MSDDPMGEGWWQASDGKYYPPQGYAPPTNRTCFSAGVAPQEKRGFGKWLLIGVGGLFGLLAMIGIIGAAVAPPDDETALNTAAKTATDAASAAERAAPAAPEPTSPPAAEAPKPAPTTTAAPPPPSTTAKPTTTTEASRPQFSISQMNAKRKADSYLDMTAFSRKSLIEQLQYEGFSEPDATFGVDALNADWNEQAARKAKSYLEMSAFSHSSLVEQLKYEGFTREQAEYGVSANGL